MKLLVAMLARYPALLDIGDKQMASIDPSK
jgi:hypothetical protein